MKWFRIFGFLLTLAICQRVEAQTATVNWTTTYQTMDGWGAEDWFGNGSVNGSEGSGFALTSSQAATFFSPTTGIGLEYIRTGNYACPVIGACAVSTALVPDLVTLQEAVANGALVDVNVQPPANLKYVGNFVESTPDPATGICVDSSKWSAFASYTVQWIQMLQSNGVPVSVLSVSNEPDQNTGDSLGGCVWTAAGLDGYIGGTLGPALSSAGLSSVKVMLPENSSWFDTDLVSTCLNDPTCSRYVGNAAGHGYGVGGTDGTDNGYCCHTATAPPASTAGKHVWMTEVNGGPNYDSSTANWIFDPSMTDALVWAHSIHDYLTVANAITSARMSVVGNWSKFVRTGWVRIGATANPVTGVFVTAFNQTSSGGFAIVAINSSNSNTTVTFSLSGFPRSPSSVTPWTTSSTLNLAQQSAVSVSDASYTYTLPASSVTSFVGNTTTGPVPPTPPAPPTQLMESVQ